MNKFTIVAAMLLVTLSNYAQENNEKKKDSTQVLKEVIINSNKCKYKREKSTTVSKMPLNNIENPQVYISRLAYERDLAKRERDKAETELISIRAQRYELLQSFELIVKMKPNTIAGEVRCFHIARQDAMKVIAKLKGGSK